MQLAAVGANRVRTGRRVGRDIVFLCRFSSHPLRVIQAEMLKNIRTTLVVAPPAKLALVAAEGLSAVDVEGAFHFSWRVRLLRLRIMRLLR